MRHNAPGLPRSFYKEFRASDDTNVSALSIGHISYFASLTVASLTSASIQWPLKRPQSPSKCSFFDIFMLQRILFSYITLSKKIVSDYYHSCV